MSEEAKGVLEAFRQLPVVRQAAIAALTIFLSGFAARGALADIVDLERRVNEIEPKVNYLFCVTRYEVAGKDPAACVEQLPPELRALP